MIKQIFFTILLFVSLLANLYALDLQSPLGTWQTTNDKSKQPASLIIIKNENKSLVGRIEQLLPGSTFKSNDLCSLCPGPLKNQAIIGLRFLWDFIPDKNGAWSQGRVLDPHNGHIYQGTLRLVDQGKKLELRGYWGPFWRSQIWTRVNT